MFTLSYFLIHILVHIILYISSRCNSFHFSWYLAWCTNIVLVLSCPQQFSLSRPVLPTPAVQFKLPIQNLSSLYLLLFCCNRCHRIFFVGPIIAEYDMECQVKNCKKTNPAVSTKYIFIIRSIIKSSAYQVEPNLKFDYTEVNNLFRNLC